MRHVAFLLAISVSLLAFAPGLTSLLSNCDKEVNCCVDSCEPFAYSDEAPDSEERGSCDGNSCNPFQSCGTNFILSLNAFDTNLQNLEVSTDRNFTYQFNIHSQFLSDFWQPPQITLT